MKNKRESLKHFKKNTTVEDFVDSHKGIVFNDNDSSNKVELVESEFNDFESENVVEDLFLTKEVKDNMLTNIFDDKSEIIESKLEELNAIIWGCNECVSLCVIDIFNGKDDNETYLKHKTKFCELRYRATQLRINQADFEFEKFILESGELFDYLVGLSIKAVKESIK